MATTSWILVVVAGGIAGFMVGFVTACILGGGKTDDQQKAIWELRQMLLQVRYWLDARASEHKGRLQEINAVLQSTKEGA